MCVVVGGMGEALRGIASQAKRPAPTTRKLDLWVLSPGAGLSMEYSLRALICFFSRPIIQQRTTLLLRKLVPVALASIFSLHRGLEECRQTKAVSFDPKLADTISASCRETAAHIQTLASGSLSSLGHDVVAWLNSLNAAPTLRLGGLDSLD